MEADDNVNNTTLSRKRYVTRLSVSAKVVKHSEDDTINIIPVKLCYKKNRSPIGSGRFGTVTAGKILSVCAKGQLISKANCQAVNSSKKRTNEFVFTTMQRVFVCFLEEIEDSKKAFRNYLTFKSLLSNLYTVIKVVKESMYPDQDFCL